tara:strand:+ start:74579 stop:75529 length:951 start_codon:yes stop_codon:yes gene_type:complete
MKKWIKFELSIVVFAIVVFLITSCKDKIVTNNPEAIVTLEAPIIQKKRPLSTEFKKYWYSGNAEITSYTLEQARYGELREGNAVLIYVTEPFLANQQVKADQNNSDNIPVLKLNSTKNYLTGIYPYSIMTSSFYPVHDNSHALKVSFSAQEWCGHVYAQLNNKDKFNVVSHSYFANEADQEFSLEKTILENEIWNKIRINPSNLPLGAHKIIPSFEFLRLRHKELKAYDAVAKLEVLSEGISTYTMVYPELERTLTINFTTSFPHSIESWSEIFESGFGANSKLMTTMATKNKSIITPYWQQNKNSDLFLRDSLGL